jgi:type IV pilus assembly protein PilW
MMMHSNTQCCRKNARGFSLIEMMIAIVIGIILSIGLIQVMIAGKTAAQTTQGANFMQENARFATSQLSYSLQMADHWGPANPDKSAATAAAQTAFNAITTICPGLNAASTTTYVTGQNWWTLGIWGIDGSADPALALGSTNCLPERVSGSDVVVLRYADSNFIQCTDVACTATTPAINAQALYVRTAVGKNMVLATGAEITALSTQTYATPLDAGYYESPDRSNQDGLYTFPYRIEIYYVRTCSTPIGGACTTASDNGSPIHTLWRRRLVTDNNCDGTSNCLTLEPVVEGIDRVQFEYALASTDVSSGVIPTRFTDVQTYESANGVGTGAGAFNWLKVVNVRVGLLAQGDSFNSSGTRGNISQESLQGSRLLGSGATTYTPSDPLLQYAVFTTSGQLRNRDKG